MPAPATTAEWNLVRRRDRLLRALRELLRSNLMRGSIVESSRSCGRPTCVCAREGKKHPRRVLAVKVAGRTRTIHLDVERAPIAAAATANYRRLWSLVDELTVANLALLAGGKRVRRARAR